MPDHFILYRDGVGEGMRKKVIETEVAQFKETIHSYYNKAKKPSVTVIIVNKRIS